MLVDKMALLYLVRADIQYTCYNAASRLDQVILI
jgi:hypothetical protein